MQFKVVGATGSYALKLGLQLKRKHFWVNSTSYTAPPQKFGVLASLYTGCGIDGFHSIFSLWQLEGITSPCWLLIASHDLFALQFLYTVVFCMATKMVSVFICSCHLHMPCKSTLSLVSMLTSHEKKGLVTIGLALVPGHMQGENWPGNEATIGHAGRPLRDRTIDYLLINYSQKL